MDAAFGSRTSVFTGCFHDDYKNLISKDPEALPTYAATGLSPAMLANRISWFFNLTGASVNFDSACSSSMLALDMAVQGLRSGDSDMVSSQPCSNGVVCCFLDILYIKLGIGWRHQLDPLA